MKNQPGGGHFRTRLDGAQKGSGNVGLLVCVVCFLIAVGSWFYWRSTRTQAVAVPEVVPLGVVLSEPTTKILTNLEMPVELRLFVPQDRQILSDVLRDYVGRVEVLLAEYERVAAGKLRVIQSDPQADAAAKVAAGAAGVMPFVGGNGEIIYLGLTIGAGNRVESLAPLAPEWEAALESDLSRAISRVTPKLARSTQPVLLNPTQPAPIDPNISEELVRAFPDLARQSFEDVAKILREHTLAEFKSAAAEMQTKVAEAQKELAEAHAKKSEAEVLAAQKNLQRVQADQTSKINAITARLQERIGVLQQIKTAPNLPATARE